MSQVLTREYMLDKCPSLFSEDSYKMSDKYRKINTYKIIEAMQDSGYYPVKVSQNRVLNQDKREFARHIVRFRQEQYLSPSLVNDRVPEIILMNSHDGSSAYKMMLGIFRLVCSNGLIVSDSEVDSVSIRHSGSVDLFNRIIESARTMASYTSRIQDKIENWKGITLDLPIQTKYAEGAIKLWQGERDVRVEPTRILYSSRYEERTNTSLWNTFNVIQENMIKGRFYAQRPNGSYHKARKITSIANDVSLNKKLWEYTDTFMNN